MIDGLCVRYSCLPSQLLREDVSLLRMLTILSMGGPTPESGGYPQEARPSQVPDIEKELMNMSKVNVGQ